MPYVKDVNANLKKIFNNAGINTIQTLVDKCSGSTDGLPYTVKTWEGYVFDDFWRSLVHRETEKHIFSVQCSFSSAVCYQAIRCKLEQN